MTRIDVGTGVSLDYEIHGDDGPWIVLIMGLAYGRWGWHWNARPLAERGYRVVSFDNRGVGGSDAPEGDYTAAMMAADTAGLMDALAIPRATVVGTSLGGFIAQELALARPELIERLVLACTGFGGGDYVPMPQRTVDLIQIAPSLPDEERMRRFVENAFSESFVRDRPDVVDAVIDFRRASNQPLAAYMSQWNAGATFDTSGRVHAIGAETLCITGDEDAVVDCRNTPLLAARLPHAGSLILPGGHLFFIEQAQRFNRIVANFASGGLGAVTESPAAARAGDEGRPIEKNR